MSSNFSGVSGIFVKTLLTGSVIATAFALDGVCNPICLDVTMKDCPEKKEKVEKSKKMAVLSTSAAITFGYTAFGIWYLSNLWS